MATPARIAAALLLLATYTQYTTAFHPRSITHQSRVVVPSSLLSLRGGSDSDHDSEYDSEEEEEEPIIQKTKALASSTKSKLQKTKNASVKSAAAKAMSSSKPIKTSGGNSVAKLYRRMVPHIIRACLNPFTFVRMSRAYFASLLDINYMKEEPAQNLRSALEQKARQQPSANNGPPKRKMKPGQAKTLSDLPQLSA